MLTLTLPLPPSTNALLTRGRRHVYRSRQYTAWLHEADGVAMQHKVFRGSKPIEGYYSVYILLPLDCPLDIDNPVKALLDWLQNRGLTANDRKCRQLHVEFSAQMKSGWLGVIVTELVPDEFHVKQSVNDGVGVPR